MVARTQFILRGLVDAWDAWDAWEPWHPCSSIHGKALQTIWTCKRLSTSSALPPRQSLRAVLALCRVPCECPALLAYRFSRQPLAANRRLPPSNPTFPPLLLRTLQPNLLPPPPLLFTRTFPLTVAKATWCHPTT